MIVMYYYIKCNDIYFYMHLKEKKRKTTQTNLDAIQLIKDSRNLEHKLEAKTF